MDRAERFLAEGRYQEAFRELVKGTRRGPPPRVAKALLRLAEFYSLYGEAERENLRAALEEAQRSHPKVAEDPLFQALSVFLKSLEGGEPELFSPPTPRAAFHLAHAAMAADRPEAALRLLENAHPLPEFLAWRVWDLRAAALLALGRFGEALSAYRQALPLAQGEDRAFLVLDAAQAALDAGRPEEALALLSEHEPPPIASAEASWRYLEARAHLALGNPRVAWELLAQAEAKEEEIGDPSYGVALLKGQTAMELGRFGEAEAAFVRALGLAPSEEKGFARHELAIARLELGRHLEAEGLLKALAADPAYPYRGSAAADLAELFYRLMDYEAAAAWAREAVLLGNAAAGELFLGHIAYDRMHLEEALERYRRVAELAPEGGREWLAAQQTAVEVLAQLGYPDPEEVLERAEAALRHTPPADEWAGTLKFYAEEARRRLGEGRILN